MGQASSKEGTNLSSADDVHLEQLTKSELSKSFKRLCVLSLKPQERSEIMKKFNIVNIKETHVITLNDFINAIGLDDSEELDVASHGKYRYSLSVMYKLFKTIGAFPFIKNVDTRKGLLFEEFLISIVILLQRAQKVFPPEYSMDKLLLVAFSNIQGNAPLVEEKVANDSDTEDKDKDPFLTVQVKRDPRIRGDSEFPDIIWSTVAAIKNYDLVNLDDLDFSAYALLQLMTLFLIYNAVSTSSKKAKNEELLKYVKQWSNFESFALSLLRYFNVYVTSNNVKDARLSFADFDCALSHGINTFFVRIWLQIIDSGLLSGVAKPHSPSRLEMEEKSSSFTKSLNRASIEKRKSIEFVESKLVNDASISFLSAIFECLDAKFIVNKKQLIKLYSGSEDGFSMRSLEAKIFKWQAPTLMFVSGKRIKNDKVSSNRRYQQFIEEFPRYFSSLENHLQDWQSERDKLEYVVAVKHPWQHSNKHNFGDENTVILNLGPRFDYYKSISNTAVSNKLLYFNTLGFGIGVGDDQPLNKNGRKRFLPGDVSLTIESNLEFAVFRHILSGTGPASYFQHSKQFHTRHDEFEDRFIITSLEVWGVGSFEEYEEQRKQWELDKKLSEARQSINLKNLGEERAFLEMAGLIGNRGSGGSI